MRKLSTALIGLALLITMTACVGTSAQTNDGYSSGHTDSLSEDHGAVETSSNLPPLNTLNLLENPKDYVGASTAQLAHDAIPQLVDAGQAKLPTTVQSADRSGPVPVTVTDTSRVLALSMSGHLAGMMQGLGLADKLIGKDVSTNFPGTEDLPVVTKAGHSIDAEHILSLEPTLIITDGTVGPLDVVLQLREAGIPVVFVDRDPSFENTYTVAEQIGAALGVPEAGTELAQKIRDQVDEKLAEIAAIAPADEADRLDMLFLYIRGGNGIYYVFGEESGATAIIDAIAGNDAAAEYGWVGMKPMTDEAMVAMNPDLILLMSDGLESVGGPEGLLTTLPSVALTDAGKNQRFVDMDDTVVLSFGPRSADVIDALARAVYAPEDQQ